MSNSTAAQLQRGVIVEFDFSVLSGHAFLSDICRARLEKEGIKADGKLMSRHMGGKSPRRCDWRKAVYAALFQILAKSVLMIVPKTRRCSL